MSKKSKFTLYDELNRVRQELENNYNGFTKKKKMQLYSDYSIDSAYDYADSIMYDLEKYLKMR